MLDYIGLIEENLVDISKVIIHDDRVFDATPYQPARAKALPDLTPSSK